ncbi:MAG: hypothetical protein ACKVZ0_11835 [Gemmatimonadales bacterium]
MGLRLHPSFILPVLIVGLGSGTGTAVGQPTSPSPTTADSLALIVRPDRDTFWLEPRGRIPLEFLRASIQIGGTNGGGRLEITVARDRSVTGQWLAVADPGERSLPWQTRAYPRATTFRRNLSRDLVATIDSGATSWRFTVGLPREAVAFLPRRGPWTGQLLLWLDRRTVSGWVGPIPVAENTAALALTPMAIGNVRAQRSGLIGTSTIQEFGGTVRLVPTSGIEVWASATPRFAETEPDEQRINLTRYRLFQPDRRTGMSELDPRFDPVAGADLALFHSRRLGFDTLGLSVPIRGFGTVHAAPGGVQVDALGLLTEETRTSRSQVYGALRLRRRLGGLTVGALAVQRSAPDAPFLDRNRTFAADGSLRLGRGWVAEGWTAQTQTPQYRGGDQAYSLGLTHRGDRAGSVVRFTQVGEFFNPEVGFLTDRGYRRYEGAVGVRFGGLGVPGAEAVVVGADAAGNFRLTDRFHLSSTLRLTATAELAGGWQVDGSVTRRHEGLLDPFAIASTVTLPRGQYRWTEAGLGLRAAITPTLRFAGRVEGGGFLDGTAIGGAAVVDWRVARGLETSVLADLNHVRIGPGNFDRVLVGARLAVRPFGRLRTNLLVQYNNSVRLWTANARLSWLDRHGAGLTIAFNDAHEADRPWRWVRPQVRSVTVQLSHRIGVGGAVSRW